MTYSALSNLNIRVKRAYFSSGIFYFELPVRPIFLLKVSLNGSGVIWSRVIQSSS